MPCERSRSSTVKPTRSSAKPTRRHARSKLSSTCTLEPVAAFNSLERACRLGALATAALALVSSAPRRTIRRARNSASRPGSEGRAVHTEVSLAEPVSTSSAPRWLMKISVVPFGPRSRRVRNLSRSPVEYSESNTLPSVLRNLGAVFSPVGFHHAGIRRLDVDQKTGVLPEVLDRCPQLFRCLRDDQPALRTIALDTQITLGLRRHGSGVSSRTSLLFQAVAGCSRYTLVCFRNRIAVVALQLCQIRRYFESWTLGFFCALVVDTVPFQHVADGAASCEAGESQSNHKTRETTLWEKT